MKTFLIDSSALWTVAVLAVAAGVALIAAEWRRPDTRRRSWRLGATMLAVGALALWAMRPAWGGGRAGAPAGETFAALWTPSARIDPVPAGAEARHRFALPGANVPADAGATFLPDAATLRRRFPEVGLLRVLGDGLEPSELPALAGLRVEFAGGTAVGKGPAVLSLSCPRVLALGAELAVEGRVGGLPPGGAAALSLEGPDGTATDGTTAPADGNGEAGFLLRAPSPNAAGRFAWRLRLKENAGENARVTADETLGVEVRAPTLPRVLVLESAPRFDTANLRRWYEAAGGSLRARLRLGQDRYRFFSAADKDGSAPAGEFNALDAPLLAGCDLLLADGRALASLPAPERAVLRAAVTDTGLGLLVLADDALLPPATVAPDRAWLFPWQLRPLETAAGSPDNNADAEHLARIRWPGLAHGPELPLPTDPFEIVLRPGQAGAIRDDQGRLVAATAGLGRGTLALTLVRETGRWQRANDPGAFAGYWSWLFAQTARPLDTPGRWTLAGGDDGPVFVDQGLELVWTGAAGSAPPGPIQVADESGPVVLAPISDPGEPGRWRVAFWPRRAGWHRIGSGAAASDFYVNAAGSWLALAAERRRAATARFAARSGDAPTNRAPGPAEPVPIPAGWWFGAFLLGAGFLWTERRLARA